MAEAAGFVLAAFPIVVEGLRIYVNGIRSIKKLGSYRKYLEEDIRGIDMENEKLDVTLRLLLREVVDDSTLKILLDTPETSRWNDDDVQDSLRTLLGKRFEIFSRGMRSMNEALTEIKSILDLDADNQPKSASYKFYKRELRRVQFSFNRDRIKALIQKIRDVNYDLKEISQPNSRKEDKKLPNSSKNAKNYEKIRDHATNLFEVLEHTFTQDCGCVMPHNASLRLEYRNGVEVAVDTHNICFTVLFFFQSDQLKAPPWNWRETRVEPVSTNLLQIQVAAAFGASANVHGDTSSPTGSAKVVKSALAGHHATHGVSAEGGKSMVPRTSSRKTVAFAQDTPPFKSPVPGARQSPDQPASVMTEKIQCLCLAMLNINQKPCLGIIGDELDKNHRISITKTWAKPMETISLSDMLAKGSLSMLQRRVLGVKLASNLLQLHSTPWLMEEWGKRDVWFVRQKDTADIALDKPYLSKCFLQGCSPEQGKTTRQLAAPYWVRNKGLYALGIILIELCFGKAFEELQLPSDLGPNDEPNAYTECATLRRLVYGDVAQEAGIEYGNAVRRCIFFEFDQQHVSLDTKTVKEAVHRDVVSPLEQTLIFLCGPQLSEVLGIPSNSSCIREQKSESGFASMKSHPWILPQ